MILNDFQNKVDEFITRSENGGYWQPLAMLAAMVEEVGESARIINAIEGNKPLKIDLKPPKELLYEELGDIFFALCCIANYYQISLDKSLTNTITKYRTRNSK